MQVEGVPRTTSQPCAHGSIRTSPLNLAVRESSACRDGSGLPCPAVCAPGPLRPDVRREHSALALPLCSGASGGAKRQSFGVRLGLDPQYVARADRGAAVGDIQGAIRGSVALIGRGLRSPAGLVVAVIGIARDP